jgi:hypothetical protein
VSDEAVTLCVTCANLCGCPLLVNEAKKKPFDPELVITEDRPRTCDQWEEISDAEAAGRARAYEIGGLGVLHAIHQSLELGLEEERMDEIPDFTSMIRDGMTVAEREEQLRFETDSAGAVIVDDAGQKIPRSAFPLRKYAADQDGPLKKPNRVVMFWPTDQLIDQLLKAEVEAGWIKDDGSKRTKKRATPKKAEPERKDEEEMAEAKKPIQLRRPVSSGGGKAETPSANGATSKVASPATGKKRIASPLAGKKAAATEEKEEKSSVPAKASKGAGTAEGSSAPDISKQLEKALAPLVKELAGIKEELAELKGIVATDERLTMGFTVLHDVLMQRITNNLIQVHKLLASEEADVPDDPNEFSLLSKEDDDGNRLTIFAYLEGDEGGDEAQEEGNDE